MLVVASERDASWGESLTAFLRSAGFHVDDHTPDTAQNVVVLLSAAALEDPVWRSAVEAISATRVVPIRLTPLDSTRVPEALSAINWIAIDPVAPQSSFGVVMAALRSNPELHLAARSLRLEAEAWARGGARSELLVRDRRHAVDLDHLLRQLQSDPLLAQDAMVFEFVRRSLRSSSRVQTRTWLTRAGALVVALIAVAVALTFVPSIRLLGRNNHSTIGTVGDRAIQSQLPEWSSLLSGGLLLNGSTKQKELARTTLRRTLSQPWTLGAVDVGAGRSNAAMAAFKNGDVAVVLGTDNGNFEFGYFDSRTDSIPWRTPLGGEFYWLDITKDERTAVAVGAGGIAVVDLVTKQARRFENAGQWDEVVVTDTDRIVVAARTGDLGTAGINDDEVQVLGNFKRHLSLRRTTDGGARLLVEPEPGSYALIDGLTGSELVRTSLPAPIIDAGAVVPDAVGAVVIGPDHQLWMFGSDAQPTPTGVALPDRTDSVVALPGGRVVIGGQVEPARVVHLPSRGELGNVCRESPMLHAIIPSRDNELLVCKALVLSTVWRAPAGPIAPPTAQLSSALEATSGELVVQARANTIKFERRDAQGSSVHTDWFAPVTGEVTAISIAPDASRVLVSSALGEVVVVTAELPTVAIVVEWATPDRSPVVAAGWDDGPVVETVSGFFWRTPDCATCGTDDGLLSLLRQKVELCWSETQLSPIDSETQARLGVQVCKGPGN